MKLHASYSDLQQCAHDKCRGCRVVRQALLLSQITGDEVERLEKRDDPVYVRLLGGDSTAERTSRLQPTLQVRLGVSHESVMLVNIALTANINPSMLGNDPLGSAVPQIKSWLQDCRQGHECSNLTRSDEHPRRLIEIISDTTLRLVDTSELPKDDKRDYVALSYCWGEGHSKGRTTPCNRDKRKVSFEKSALPKTIREALDLVEAIGYKYLWVDQVCIAQKIQGNQCSDRQGDGADDCEGNGCQACTHDGGEDWDAEASRMHVIYGNAVFTLCACSSTSSRDRLLWDRKAWTYRVVPFYFEGQWLINYNMSLNEVRATAPLSKRAWTLQEERLSPRLVYYCGQRVYWSCVEKQHTETATRSTAKHDLGSRPFEREDGFKQMSEAQIFINYSFAGERVRLHREWKDLVEAYCPRAITKPTDRLPAISGLAALYLSTYITQDNKILQQEYLAGLWRDTFAEDLAWSVRTAADPCEALAEIAPSWSWASLPARTHVSIKEDFKRSNDFELLEASKWRRNSSEPGNGANVLLECQEGAKKKLVLVRGRLRQVMNRDSESIDWSEITTGRGGKNKYDLSKNIARHVHARNQDNGQIVIYEPNKQPIEGQLDYLLPLNANTNSDSHEIHVAAGMEWDLYGLQIGQKTMLLVQFSRRRETGTDSNTRSDTWVTVFRRVGICRNVREAFFEGAELVELELE
ncbi:uncharacterized protein A1O5_01178 [Cladophialophora psammophila CBS 110553]|uniref:Heterokaryon incompatibility domain-containing protein n=1 Tax=Cladophialophora psammophila CBS 110553 TaxID=1182543 RepID=W9XH48_9EURO|nr:uncharacterized protein A1O5_01178 [Cladophialophora psammophila CBS 110553]EXJ76670.1 hypothetical protein A1O5_01178 [Cladophialophora psammophila CBS 110553]